MVQTEGKLQRFEDGFKEKRTTGVDFKKPLELLGLNNKRLKSLVLPSIFCEKANKDLRERNVTTTSGKRNKKEKLRCRLWEQLGKEGEDPCVVEFYGDYDAVSPTGSIVDGDDACTTDERWEARTYVEATVRRLQQRYATIQEVAEQEKREQKTDNLGRVENTATAREKHSEEKG
uniref:Uncharacterized protein n=1 Tax=Glossina austeni TaxID=7395 RepID=A0A1A9VTV9_GLOAU